MTKLSLSDAFQGEQHQAFTLNGNSSHAWLLLHGFPGTPAEMRPIAEVLHGFGDTVHAPLLPGFGAQIDTLADQTSQRWQSYCAAEFTRLKTQHEYVGVAGLSLGGALAVQVAANQPADTLLLLAPFWKLGHILWKTLPVLKHVIPMFKPFRLFPPDWKDVNFRESIHNFMPQANLDDEETRQLIQDFEVSVSLFDEIRQTGLAGAAAAKRVTCPTLIIQGLHDELVAPATTHEYLNYFRNKPQYVELPGPHTITDTTLPGWPAVRAELQSYLEQQRKASHG